MGSATSEPLVKSPVDPNVYYYAEGLEVKPYVPLDIFRRVHYHPNHEPTNTTRSELDVDPKTRAFLVHNLLSQQECQAYIKITNQQGFSDLKSQYPEEFRNNERVLVFSDDTANALWSRLEPLLCRRDVMSIRPMGFGTSGTWRPFKINECMKFSKYKPGTRHKAHMDGPYVPRQNECSIYTVLIYLNDDFEGGETRFLKKPEDPDAAVDFGDSAEMLTEVKPVQGSAVIFTHDSLHEGTEIKSGTKYIIRTEIMFQRTDANAIPESVRDRSSQESYERQQSLEAEGLKYEEDGKVTEGTKRFHESLKLQVQERRSTQDLSLLDDQVLPPDIMIHLLAYLSAQEIASYMILSKTWYDICMDGVLWKKLFKRRFPEQFNLEKKYAAGPFHADKNAHVKDWYTTYRQKIFVSNHFRAVVIDTGAYYTKAGVFAHSEPRMQLAIVPSQVATVKANHPHSQYFGDRYIVGEHDEMYLSKRSGPYENAIQDFVPNIDLCREVWDDLYNKFHLVLCLHPVMIAEPVGGYDDQSKAKIKKVFLEAFRSPGICFVPRAVLILRSYDKESGVVISLSDSSQTASVIYRGKVAEYLVIRYGVEIGDHEIQSIAAKTIQIVKSAAEKISVMEKSEEKSFGEDLQQEFLQNVAIEGVVTSLEVNKHFHSLFIQEMKKLGRTPHILREPGWRDDCNILVTEKIRESDRYMASRTFSAVIGGLKLANLSHFESMCSNDRPQADIILDGYTMRKRVYRRYRHSELEYSCELCYKPRETWQYKSTCVRCELGLCSKCAVVNVRRHGGEQEDGERYGVSIDALCIRCSLEMDYPQKYREHLVTSSVLEFYVKVGHHNKLATFLDLWDSYDKRAIVYCNEQRTAEWLVKRVQNEDNANQKREKPIYFVHDEMTLQDFKATLDEYRENGQILFSTDTRFPRQVDDPRDAATFVVNFDCPLSSASKDHRIGNLTDIDEERSQKLTRQMKRKLKMRAETVVLNFVETDGEFLSMKERKIAPLPDVFKKSQNRTTFEPVQFGATSLISLYEKRDARGNQQKNT